MFHGQIFKNQNPTRLSVLCLSDSVNDQNTNKQRFLKRPSSQPVTLKLSGSSWPKARVPPACRVAPSLFPRAAQRTRAPRGRWSRRPRGEQRGDPSAQLRYNHRGRQAGLPKPGVCSAGTLDVPRGRGSAEKPGRGRPLSQPAPALLADCSPADPLPKPSGRRPPLNGPKPLLRIPLCVAGLLPAPGPKAAPAAGLQGSRLLLLGGASSPLSDSSRFRAVPAGLAEGQALAQTSPVLIGSLTLGPAHGATRGPS